MSDEHNTPRPKSMPPPVPQRRSVPPPEPTVRDAVAPGDARPMSTRQFRSTTRMTTDEIEAVIAANRAAAAAGGAAPEGFDPERTMVLDPDEDGVDSADAVDEAPTVDYDPRQQLPQTRSGRPAAGTGPLGTPLIPPAPRVPALTQPSNASMGGESLKDTGKKRSSRRTVKIPDDPVARRDLPQVISREPLGPYVRRGDEQWANIVRWTVQAMLAAEVLDLRRDNVQSERRSNDPDVQHLLGVTPGNGKALGLDEDWAFNIILQVGNYGESFERNLGARSMLKLARGQNALWRDGGLMYPLPMR